MLQTLMFWCGILLLASCLQVQSQLVVVGSRYGNYTYDDYKEDILTPSVVNVVCSPTTMCISLSKNWLQEQWEVNNFKRVTLIESCDQSKDANDTHVTLCTEASLLTSCGTTFTVNDSHVIYSNNVTVQEVTGNKSSVTNMRTLPWKCVYPVRLLVGVEFIPQISPTTQFLGQKSGEGVFRAAMFMYKDEDYTSIYEYSPTLQMDDRIRVRVQLLQGPSLAKVQVTRCWSTPEPLESAQDAYEYELIRRYCPSPVSYEADVNVISNGEHKHVTWESNVFRFVGFPNVYLHCSLRVCFDGDDCVKTCDGDIVSALNRRKRREINPDNVVVSLGPLKPGSGVPTVGRNAESQAELTTTTNRPEKIKETEVYLLGLPRIAVYILIIVLVVVTLAMVFASAICIVRRSKARKNVTLTSSAGDVNKQPVVEAMSYSENRSVAMPTG
uniref:ZP domain-containing protein-like n=1 Tax=Phallusia mammillata TaxID=59560 RepID=A0A6F9DY47_9ASCI|nr:ZP domain-containing protein-like [Phallusia mammillata]